MPEFLTIRYKSIPEKVLYYIQKETRRGKSATEVTIDLLEKGFKSYSGHAQEDPKTPTVTDYSKTDATGLILKCPLRSSIRSKYTGYTTIHTFVDSSVCKTCADYPCDEAWGWIREEDLKEIPRAIPQIPTNLQWMKKHFPNAKPNPNWLPEY